jgi:hypothetical protein
MAILRQIKTAWRSFTRDENDGKHCGLGQKVGNCDEPTASCNAGKAINHLGDEVTKVFLICQSILRIAPAGKFL